MSIHLPSAPWLALVLTGVALVCFGASWALWPRRIAALNVWAPGRVS